MLLYNGDVAIFIRRRPVELKHGRIGMFSGWPHRVRLGRLIPVYGLNLVRLRERVGCAGPRRLPGPFVLLHNGDVAIFIRRRSVELKHGRIHACQDGPHYVGGDRQFPRLPPYDPAGLKFVDIPYGVAAIPKVPALGWRLLSSMRASASCPLVPMFGRQARPASMALRC